MKIRLLVGLAGAVLVAAFMPAPASAQVDGQDGSATVTATVSADNIGFRAVTTVSPIALSAVLNDTTLNGAYNVVVTETARTGSTPWTVSASLAGALSDGGTNTIPTTAVSIGTRAVAQVAGGGTAVAPTGSEVLDASRQLFQNTGQSLTAVYTGTYTATGNLTLTPPNGTATGIYTGTFNVDLVN